MSQFVYVISNAAYLLIGALQLLMFIRAILSWLPMLEDNALTDFVYSVTEVVIYPVRCLVERSELLASMPIDISFFITFVLLSLIQTALM
ncbi:MAG: YggT family protein [Clostridia bacterium]|nr:YggT family protein [Clostridia bacterium]